MNLRLSDAHNVVETHLCFTAATVYTVVCTITMPFPHGLPTQGLSSPFIFANLLYNHPMPQRSKDEVKHMSEIIGASFEN